MSYVLLALIILVPMEAILRYAFNAPTIWSRDVSLQIQGLILAVSGGYLLVVEGHVRVDALVSKLSTRKRALLELLTSAIFFIGVGALLWQTGTAGWESLITREHTSSLWAPPIFPLKVVIPICILFLFLQGIAKFIESLLVVLIGNKR